MRGTQCDEVTTGAPVRIIPAHAGNTRVVSRSIAASRDHPRACGEHSDVAIISGTLIGSSPRMRGTPDSLNNSLNGVRIIPAHAGNTARFAWEYAPNWDHPRACGEHSSNVIFFGVVTGSSPRMRGTHTVMRACLRIGGIIPAHAGNTCRPSNPLTIVWDHPRACGEHLHT